jgi:GNAT superfamily N-acetyltransferase
MRSLSLLRRFSVAVLVCSFASCGGGNKDVYVEKPIDDLYNKAMDQMVEERYQVATLPAYRERGLAKATVSAAIAAAGEWGADQVTVPADADDWPQVLYAKLGFEPIGVQLSFTLRHPPGAGFT